MLTPVGAGVTVTPIITVGETAGDDGYIFEAIPDGIALKPRGKGTVEVYVNHETSRGPVPVSAPARRADGRRTPRTTSTTPSSAG